MHKAKAQEALTQLKQIIEAYVKAHPGVKNSTISRELGLESDFQGSQKDWSILGLLVNENRIRTTKVGAFRYYYPIEE